MKDMKNINDMLLQATNDYMNSQECKEMIDTKAKDAVDNVIKNAFSGYGILSKTIEKQLEEEVGKNALSLGLDGFTKAITETFRNELANETIIEAKAKAVSKIQEMLSPLPKLIDVEFFKEKLFDYGDHSSFCGSDELKYEEYEGKDSDIFSLYIEKNDNYSWIDLYFNDYENTKQDDCKYNITIHQSGDVTIWKEKEKIRAKEFINPKRGLELFLNQLFLNDAQFDYADFESVC